jgi:hypothetical protein
MNMRKLEANRNDITTQPDFGYWALTYSILDVRLLNTDSNQQQLGKMRDGAQASFEIVILPDRVVRYGIESLREESMDTLDKDNAATTTRGSHRGRSASPSDQTYDAVCLASTVSRIQCGCRNNNVVATLVVAGSVVASGFRRDNHTAHLPRQGIIRMTVMRMMTGNTACAAMPRKIQKRRNKTKRRNNQA